MTACCAGCLVVRSRLSQTSKASSAEWDHSWANQEPASITNSGTKLEPIHTAGRKELITWSEFSRRYRMELKEAGSIDARNRNIKNHGQKFTLRLLQQLGRSMNVTLMCHCDEDQQHCHRHLLQKVLRGKI